MQEKIIEKSDFIRRTDDLALKLRKQVSELPEIIGISQAMFFGYKSGKYKITMKVIRKLENAEKIAGIFHSETVSKEIPLDTSDIQNTRCLEIDPLSFRNMKINSSFSANKEISHIKNLKLIQNYFNEWFTAAHENPNISAYCISKLSLDLPLSDIEKLKTMEDESLR